MNAVFFDLKRAFHASLNITRPMLADAGLTPARFDMLYALYDSASETDFDPDGEDAFQAYLAEERMVDELAMGHLPDVPLADDEPEPLLDLELSADVPPDSPPGRPTARTKTVLQSALVRLLGVSRMTVSRMVRALEVLGLVHRRPVRPGARRLLVELTARGLDRLCAVLNDLVDGGGIDLATDSILEPDAWFDAARVHTTRERLQHLMRRIRDGGGDRATLRYLWRPDD